ncbi:MULTISPECIES: hypothetical protein [Bacillus]|nr:MULTISPECIES: hypothetical protein [Bacillus]
MFQSHGIGYEEYSREINNIIQVEKNREREYKKSMQIVAELERKCHT